MLHFKKRIYFSGYYLMFQALKGCYKKIKKTLFSTAVLQYERLQLCLLIILNI